MDSWIILSLNSNQVIKNVDQHFRIQISGFMSVCTQLSVMNLVQCFKWQKSGYKQTCCSLDVTYLKCGVKDRSDAICQRPMHYMNYTTLISLDCPSFCRRVQFTKSKLKRACFSWRLKGSIPSLVKVQECYMC